MRRGLIIGVVILGAVVGLVWGLNSSSTEAEARAKARVGVDEVAVVEPVPTKTYLGNWRVTCYCSCVQCCGKYALNRPTDENGNEIVYGAYGTQLRAGISCASSATFPPGTRLYLEGYGEVVVEDKTAGWIQDRYDGEIVDIYVNTHEDAYSISGYKEVWLINDSM